MMTSTPVAEHPLQPADDRIACLNCDHYYVGQYCNQCGQQADTHRIDWRYLWREITENLWGLDRGILFTLRELFTRPGYSIREFLAGRRVSHYRPLALLLLLAGIYLFVSQGLDIDLVKTSQDVYGKPGPNPNSPVQVKETFAKVGQFYQDNQQFGDLAMVPFMAFWYWRLFRRRGYNYPEMLVAQTFIANFNMLFSLIVLLAFWGMGNSASVLTSISSVSFLIQLGYNSVVYTQLYKGKLKPLRIVLRSVGAYMLGYVSFILVIGFSIGMYALIVGFNAGFNADQPKTLPKKPTPATSQHARH